MSIKTLKIIVFILCLYPLARMGWRVPSEVDPVAWLLHSSGRWALTGLLITLSISPLRQLTGRGELLKLRRMLGLYAFFYAVLHFCIYLGLDRQLDFSTIGRDILKRPYITVGFSALLLLIPLAVTSTDAMMRRLKRNWGRLHQLVYPIAILGVLHFWWLVKRDVSVPEIYAVLLALLLGWRVWRWWKRRAAG
ncbi:sulfoxide reductase heme-binding subunit YedZ [Andreprevotia lacus DSM 23236]|jgi:sulfoxide reductase heme-binding subunit YedZ|uniref:Protein-methionine-sulfoxide reductase heme-binding subunit MsrQ n=1 Tax=Andreprevotia lacus DSM 23236 TaxID=1121001 RepID=A0A1W1XUV7_9NEIS|nr:protein-methionine-sulfoxide reductase heme-binding subunit MsrQ [Andreprevotia lacus]SMC27321.1 sulfoxide reductase heme-binding subunit YedZ [Andreprevotia lacus DSM 23236]